MLVEREAAGTELSARDGTDARAAGKNALVDAPEVAGERRGADGARDEGALGSTPNGLLKLGARIDGGAAVPAERDAGGGAVDVLNPDELRDGGASP